LDLDSDEEREKELDELLSLSESDDTTSPEKAFCSCSTFEIPDQSLVRRMHESAVPEKLYPSTTAAVKPLRFILLTKQKIAPNGIVIIQLPRKAMDVASL